MDFEGPLTQRSPFLPTKRPKKPVKKVQLHFRLFRGTFGIFQTKLFPSIKAPQFFNDFLQIGIPMTWPDEKFRKKLAGEFLVTLHDLLGIQSLGIQSYSSQISSVLKKKESALQHANLGRTKKSPPQRW